MSELKSIQEHQKEGLGEIINKYLTSDWYFDKWYEKIILIILGALGMCKIYEFIF